jgi:hypothetical protein
VPISAPIRSGTVVYDVADPRRHGIVNSLNLRDGRFVAKVRWIDTGLKGDWMPVADLRRVKADTSSQPVRGRRWRCLSKPGYGRWDGCAVRYTHDEAWVLVNGQWRQIEPVFARIRADRLTRQAFRETFGRVPPLPRDAFSSDPSRWPIRYGHHKDGTACRFRNHEVWEFYGGKWHEIMPSELVYNVKVMTEREYLQMYGPTGRWPVPPLPDAAFSSGWSSPLV